MKKKKKHFWQVVDEVIRKSDIIISVLDARYPKESRNKDVEKLIKKSGRALIFAINKKDLATKEQLRSFNESPKVFINARTHRGIGKLKQLIMIIAKKRNIKNPRVGFVGYPNVGKSSLINAFAGRKSARTSSVSGFTKGKQNIRARKILLVDTPGVVPSYDKDISTQAKFGAVGSSYLEDPMSVVIEIMEKNIGVVEKYYDVKVKQDKEETIEEIAKKKHFLIKGGRADTDRISRRILKLMQDGKIN